MKDKQIIFVQCYGTILLDETIDLQISSHQHKYFEVMLQSLLGCCIHHRPVKVVLPPPKYSQYYPVQSQDEFFFDSVITLSVDLHVQCANVQRCMYIVRHVVNLRFRVVCFS